MNYNDFYQFVEDNGLEFCFKMLEYGSRLMKNIDDENEIYNKLWDTIQKSIKEGKQIGLELFVPLVDDVIAALSTFVAGLDEYLEQAIIEDGYMPDGFLQ